MHFSVFRLRRNASVGHPDNDGDDFITPLTYVRPKHTDGLGKCWLTLVFISPYFLDPDIEVPVGNGMARRDAGHPKHSAAFQADQAYHDISTAEVKTESQKKFLELYQRYRWLQDGPITTIRRKSFLHAHGQIRTMVFRKA